MGAEKLTKAQLDSKGRCCGRKPIPYMRPRPRLFCPRCNAQFTMSGEQEANWAWKAEGGGFRPTYPTHDYAGRRALEDRNG